MKAGTLNGHLGRGREQAFAKHEEPLVATLERAFDEAGKVAARNFSEHATEHLTAAAASPASTMIAVYPAPEEAVALAVPNGEPAEILHCTLAFLGETDPDQAEALVAVVRGVAAEMGPLSGVVGGVASFGSEPDAEEPLYPSLALPDVPGLAELRQAVCDALLAAGVDWARNHGWTPHVTLAYTPEPSPPPMALVGQPLTFDRITVTRGDVPRDFPLGAALTASGPAGWAAPHADEVIDVEAFARTLRGKTDPVRRAAIEAAMTPALAGVGIDFDATNPLVAGVLSGSGAQVTHIAETTRLNVMRSIREAYEQGLTIPDTAKLIQAGMSDAGPARARLIARTELVGVVNGGAVAAAEIVGDVAGVAYLKRWLTADGAEYPRHEDYEGLDGQTVELDAMFDVGGYVAEYPGDQGLPPEECCNCRCTVIMVEPGDEEGGGGGLEPAAASIPEPVDTSLADDVGAAMLAEEALAPGPAGWAWDDDETRVSLEPPLPPGYSEWVAGLNADDVAAAHQYTLGAYKDMNAALRAKAELSADQRELATRLDRLIASAPRFAQPATVWRGLDLQGSGMPDGLELAGLRGKEREAKVFESLADYAEEKFKPGEVIELGGFQSTTFNVDPALDAALSKQQPGLIFEIKTSEGAYLSGERFTHWDDESELLLPRDSKYRVVAVLREARFVRGEDPDNIVRRTVVQVEKIPSEPLVVEPAPAPVSELVRSLESDFEAVRAAREEAAQNLAAEHHVATVAEWEQRATEFARDLTEGKEARVRANPATAEKILRDGRFKSQFETGGSGGMFDPEYRAEMEGRLFGYELDIPDADRPIYGYLQGSPEHGWLDNYGRVVFVLQEGVRARATVSFEDSLSAFEGWHGKFVPSPLNDPSGRSLPARTDVVAEKREMERELAAGRTPTYDIGGYIEIQVHGGLSTSDVREVVMESSVATHSPRLLEALSAAGIPYRVVADLDEIR